MKRTFVVIRPSHVFCLLVGFICFRGASAVDQKADKEEWLHGSGPPPGDLLDATVALRGKKVYEKECADCHALGGKHGAGRAPQRLIIEQMPSDSIYRSMTTGVMQRQAKDLDDDAKRAVAQYLTNRRMGTSVQATPACSAGKSEFDYGQPPPFTGWGLEPAGSHHIPDRVAGLDMKSVKKLKLKWAMGFPNAQRARSQPAIAGGAIYVGSHDGTVYALDAATGCARWTFAASAEVRTGIVVSPWNAGDRKAEPLAYFGDIVGNAYAVDAITGKQVWRVKADPHASTTLTGTPTLYGELLYIPVSSLEEAAAGQPDYPCCTFRGSVLAVDARTGEQRWRTYFTEEPRPRKPSKGGVPQFGPSGIAVWLSPSIDEKRHRLYVATGDNYSTPATGLSDAVIAMDLATGKIAWAYQGLAQDAWNVGCAGQDKANCPEEDGPDFDFGAGVILVKGHDGREYVLAGQKSGMVYGIDPDSGALAWKTKVGRGGILGGILFGMAAVDGTLFVPVNDMSFGKAPDGPANPGIFALDIQTGRYVWKSPATDVCGATPGCSPGYSGAISVTSTLVLAGSIDGRIRVFDRVSGNALWEANTLLEVTTTTGSTAHGGSMSGGAAPIAWNGLLIVNSGYNFPGNMPGNVLLVYSAE